MVWTNFDDELFAAYWSSGMVLVNIDEYGEENLYHTFNDAITFDKSFLINVRNDTFNATLLIDTNQDTKKIVELYNDDPTPGIYYLDFQIAALYFYEDTLYIATNQGSNLIKLDFSNSYNHQAVHNTAFTSYSIKSFIVIDENEIVFTAEDKNNAGTTVFGKYEDGEITIIEATSSPIESLIKIN